MKCPYCGHLEDRVLDSRETREGAATRRRRECLTCRRRFTTYEQIEDVAPMVVKKDGRRERFDPAKLRAGLQRACEKRPIESRAVELLLNDVEAMVAERVDREISAAEIGAFLMKRLHELDKVAYVRFASVYKDFQDPEEFVREIHGILAGAKALPAPVPSSNGSGSGETKPAPHSARREKKA